MIILQINNAETTGLLPKNVPKKTRNPFSAPNVAPGKGTMEIIVATKTDAEKSSKKLAPVKPKLLYTQKDTEKKKVSCRKTIIDVLNNNPKLFFKVDALS